MTTNPNLLEPLGRWRSDLVVEPQKKDGAVGAYRVLDPNSNVSHILTETEYAVATCMNGERNAMDVARHAARLGHPVQVDHVERFHRELEGLSFVYRDQPPTLTKVPDTSHRDDAKRFVEEAKRELALGRIEVARDLLDAALAIDRVAATHAATGGAPATPSTTPVKPPPAMAGDALGPVLDYLKDWSVPVPAAPPPPDALPALVPLATTSPAPETGQTSRWTPPTFDALPPIDINLDEGSPTPPVRTRGRGRYIAAAAVVVMLVAGVGATFDLTTLPSEMLTLPEALASTPPPPAPAAPPVVASAPVGAPVVPAPVVAEAVLAATAAPVAEEAPKSTDTDVVAPAKGKFVRALVSSGLKVKEGQRIAILTTPNGKQTVITAPAAGIFEATLALGKTVGKGEVVGVVHAW
jgi:hypothetical protein